MSTVDWSKAPEGATHWMPESHFWEEGFWKREGETNYFFESGEWVSSGAKPFGHPALVKRPTIPQWSGEGLPPVGAVVDWSNRLSPCGWSVGQVIAHDGNRAVIKQNSNSYLGRYPSELRPILTPEQLAAEARDKAINEMRHIAEHDAHSRSVDYGALYDAGYRKQEQPE